ncbi:MAG: cell division protein ZapA [Gammaproteobacteria bacterium]|nr:cell division protein ZapA [Gammaproteobacteria bacterium]MBU1447420.1 cell division protein ZapA [Gammaproteobacteria bacterium]MDD2928498.1 cell division protein ZapA [Sideroxydans sp.]MDD5471172.1 cell division protein ZapA [Sideroxydans sp.]
MSEAKTSFLDVNILDREFRVACPADERGELLDAVKYLDLKMREIRDAGKIASVERIAIMAALNITHELLTTRVGGGFDLAELKRRMQSMQATIDNALVDQDQLF